MKKVEKWNMVSNILLIFALIFAAALGYVVLNVSGAEKFCLWDFVLLIANLVVSVAFKIAAKVRERKIFF